MELSEAKRGYAARGRTGSAAVSLVATVRAPTRLDGRAGVFCRGSADGRTTGYELTLIADPRPLPTGPRGEAGLVVTGDAPAKADLAAFQLSFAG